MWSTIVIRNRDSEGERVERIAIQFMSPVCRATPSKTGKAISEGSMLPGSKSAALEFGLLAREGRARVASMKLPHYTAETPMFMPVGTQGTVKGMTTSQMEACGCQVILGNTYHLENRPGSRLVEEMGGLHKFQGWRRGMLTDSGGFQMVSLLALADITEEGVTFQSPLDGERMLLTPEESIGIQNRIGADIIMALDDVVPADQINPARFKEATHRTLRWIDRCIAAHSRPEEQNLFAIVQGGLDPELRRICLDGLLERGDKLPGYAIGGLAGGESKDDFWRMVSQCTAALPEGKPRYVMGIGYPLDIVVCSALGADMYDSVFPTRTARFGTALVPWGFMKLKHNKYADDDRPIDPDCTCVACQNYTRAYLHRTATREATASQLLTIHNVHYMMQFTREMRAAIKAGEFGSYVQRFIRAHYPDEEAPAWVIDALDAAGIDVRMSAT